MADFDSKYTGEEVEEFLDQIANGEIGSGGITSETDPIFSASPAASITEDKKTEWDNKQDAISDLDTIRSGAEKGATALQSVPSEYVTDLQLMWIKAEGEAGVRLKGTNGTATGNLAISAGDDKTASDGTAFTSAASGDHAVVFGFGNTCAGRSTLAQGLYNTVNGKDSVAFGQRNTVNGDQAFAAGQQNEVTTRLGVTIGYQNKATNTNSIAIGYKNESKGSGSVALGDTCESSGTSSTAMGYKTKATGAYSSTFGENTQATNNGEVAMGVYNKSTTSTDTSEQTAFSFGIGTSDTNRANAFEIKKNGDVYIGNELLSDYVTESELSAALADKVDKVTGKGLSTEDFTSALKSKLEGLTNYDDAEISNAVSSLQSQLNTLVSGNVNDAINSFNEIIAFLEGVKDTQDLASIIASIQQQIAAKMDKVTLATVATSGSYNDLSNKPTIPSAVTESTVSGWGFTKNTGTYSKPSGGIPKTDLASAVQTSLGKADTALQSYTEQYKGTVTKVKINGEEKSPDESGIVDLGVIGGGAYGQVNHGTSDTTFTLTPNTFHVWDEVTSLTLTLGSEQSGVANEYVFQFTSGSTPTSLTLPEDIKWANDIAPTIAENKIYQISILDRLACVMEASYVNIIVFYVSGVEFYAESGMTWAEWCSSKYNTKQFVNYGSHILATYPYSGYIYVSPNSLINPNTNYSITSGSGGGN